MPDYTYPYIFPNLQENPRDLETWLSSNVVNQSEGDSMWASSTHYHADAIQINATLGGGTITNSLAEVGHYDVDSVAGIPANTDVMVDVTVEVQASGITAGQYWGAQIALQDALVGTVEYHQIGAIGVTLGGGTDSYGADHTHTWGGTSSNTTGHQHNVSGTTSQASGNTTAAGGHTHTSPGNHQHTLSGYTGNWSASVSPTHYHNHTAASISQDAAGGHTHDGISNHAHGLNDHTHTWSDLSSENGSLHTHTVSGTSGSASAYNHTHGLASYASATASGGNLAYDTISIRYVGTVNSGAGANVDLAAYARTQTTSATLVGVRISGTIWVVPTVLAAQIGSINDLPDVQASEAQPGDLFVYSGASSKWTPQTLAEAGVAAASHEHTIDDLTGVSGVTTSTYTTANVVPDRTFDVSTVTLAELANVVGALIEDLKTAGTIL